MGTGSTGSDSDATDDTAGDTALGALMEGGAEGTRGGPLECGAAPAPPDCSPAGGTSPASMPSYNARMRGQKKDFLSRRTTMREQHRDTKEEIRSALHFTPPLLPRTVSVLYSPLLLLERN